MDNKKEESCIHQYIQQIQHPSLSFREKLFLALQMSETHPELVHQLGIKWINENVFSFNVQILSQIFSCKPKSFLYCLKEYHFLIQPSENQTPGWKNASSIGFVFSKICTLDDIKKIGLAGEFTTDQLEFFQEAKLHKSDYRLLQSVITNSNFSFGLTIYQKWWKNHFDDENEISKFECLSDLLNTVNFKFNHQLYFRTIYHLLYSEFPPQQNSNPEIDFSELFEKIYLNFGRETPFDFLQEFIRIDYSELKICFDGFSLFETFDSASSRLFYSSSQWVLVLDETRHGFTLLKNVSLPKRGLAKFHVFIDRFLDDHYQIQTNLKIQTKTGQQKEADSFKEFLSIIGVNENQGLPSIKDYTKITTVLPPLETEDNPFRICKKNEFQYF